MSGDTWLSRFQQHLTRQDLAETSIEGYLADLHHFFHWLADWRDCSMDLATVTVADIRAYRQYLVNSKRQKPASVNRRLQALRRFYGWAKQAGLVAVNPAEAVRFRRRPPPTPSRRHSPNRKSTRSCAWQGNHLTA